MDLRQVLDTVRNDFSSKINKVLVAIQDVTKEAQDFLARLDEAEVGISNVEDTVDSEKAKSDMFCKQVTLLTNKLDEHRSHRLTFG